MHRLRKITCSSITFGSLNNFFKAIHYQNCKTQIDYIKRNSQHILGPYTLQHRLYCKITNNFGSRMEAGSDLNDSEILDKESMKQLIEDYEAVTKEGKSRWLEYDRSCYIYLYKGGGKPNNKIASFDLDGTIIKPKSNKRIPKTATDWQFFSIWTKVKLEQVIRENNARFVIFTNQNGVSLNFVSLSEVQERVELVTSRINIPCTVFMAINKDHFRKPCTMMFRLLLEAFNDSRTIDRDASFYCGDAIGYPSHSNADIEFAKRLRLPFLTPEKFLRGVKPKLVLESM